MKSVLTSIQPKWCELIASGKKTVEVRKTKPKLKTPFKVYIYCTESKSQNLMIRNVKECYFDDWGHLESFLVNQREAKTWFDKEDRANGKVIGEFVCDKIMLDIPRTLYASHKTVVNSCVPIQELIDYVGKKNFLYFWHISNLVIYDKLRELSEFVVEGDCLNGDCKKCKWFDGGNNYNVEADCLLPYDFHFNKSVKPLFRPPQSWCYVESEDKK